MRADEQQQGMPRASKPDGSDSHRHLLAAAERACAAMAELLNTAALECAGRDAAHLGLQRSSLAWTLDSSPDALAEAAVHAVSEGISDVSLFRSGRAYCYACGNAVCEHAAPPSCGAVFSGYESTGRPAWEEFFSYLLGMGDPRTDQLFSTPPQLLARVIGRNRLVAAQLASFGRNAFTYRIWGQVVAGYLHVRDQRCALTAQLVEDSQHRLHLQLIADDRLREALADAPEGTPSAFLRVFDAVAEARRQTASLSNSLVQGASSSQARQGVREKAFGILRHLAQSVERKGRQHMRRTGHAEIRAAQRRPVHKAYDDVAAAAGKDVFQDRFRQSIIVVGRTGRVHVFTENGRHITSLTLGREELERRVARERYVPLPQEHFDGFRAGVLAAMPSAAEGLPENGSEA
ncbi:MAG: hypothetical protein JXR77_11575 [Lentisphaeria bacterium]|nr:hypothetical protein [Lentisphaeria bacterium]